MYKRFMATSQIIDDMDYLTCPRPSHSEELSMVCHQKSCSTRPLICPICELEDHKGHQVVPLKDFLMGALGLGGGEVGGQQDQGKEVDRVVAQAIGRVEGLLKGVRGQVEGLREEVLAQLYELEQKIADYFNQISQRLIQIRCINSPQNLIQRVVHVLQERSVDKCNSLLSRISLYANGHAQEAINYYLAVSKDKLASFYTAFQDIQLHDNLTKAKMAFSNVKEYTLKASYSWGSMKAQKIQIEGMVATQTVGGSSVDRFALAVAENSPARDITVGFRLKKLKGWVGVGICLQNAIVEAGYKFNYTVNYHGSYLISANGYSWSHSQPAFNSVFKSFLFSEEDLIKMVYSPEKHCVVFVNVTKSLNFTLEVIAPPAGDWYVPCVNMCNSGDAVELVNDLG